MEAHTPAGKCPFGDHGVETWHDQAWLRQIVPGEQALRRGILGLLITAVTREISSQAGTQQWRM